MITGAVVVVVGATVVVVVVVVVAGTTVVGVGEVVVVGVGEVVVVRVGATVVVLADSSVAVVAGATVVVVVEIESSGFASVIGSTTLAAPGIGTDSVSRTQSVLGNRSADSFLITQPEATNANRAIAAAHRICVG